MAQAAPWTGEPGPDGDIAQLLYTSGTSGRPKGCVHTHRGIALTAVYTAATVPLHRDERFLICMPVWHASPLNNWTMSTLLLGATVVLQREYDPRLMLETVQRERVTAVFGAPIALIAPVQTVADFAAFDLSSVRSWIYGVGPLDADTARRLMKAYGSEDFHQAYGMSEMGPAGASLSPAEQLEKAGVIGRGGMPGVDLRVVRLDGTDAGAGQTGEIWLRSDTRMVGYLDDEQATAEVSAGDWYRSGDLGRVDEDGFVTVVDRIKDVIITGGENRPAARLARPRPGTGVPAAVPAGEGRLGVPVAPRDLGARDRTALTLFASTCLPLVVAITTIGVDQKVLGRDQAAALVGAAMVSVLVLPLPAMRLRAGDGRKPVSWSSAESEAWWRAVW
ncbi:class I adenylate-forming enzyme family protein [Streptomyces spiralis]